jgi:hypothetical protein
MLLPPVVHTPVIQDCGPSGSFSVTKATKGEGLLFRIGQMIGQIVIDTSLLLR